MESSGIIFLMPPYLAHSRRAASKAPKLYFMDTGLCAWLNKWPNASMLAQCSMNGAFFETYVVSEIAKNLLAHNLDPSDWLFHYSIKGRNEACLLYADACSITPIQIEAGVKPARRARNFQHLAKRGVEVAPGLVFSCTDKIRPVGKSAWFVPASLLP